MGKAREALEGLLRDMLAHDYGLDREDQPGGPRPPEGDDYNVLYGMVRDACDVAGVKMPEKAED